MDEKTEQMRERMRQALQSRGISLARYNAIYDAFVWLSYGVARAVVPERFSLHQDEFKKIFDEMLGVELHTELQKADFAIRELSDL